MKLALTVQPRMAWAEACADAGVRAVCLPLNALKRRSAKFVDEFLAKIRVSGAWVIVDSNVGEFDAEDEDDADAQAREYVEFIERHAAFLDAWVEIDAAEQVGRETVERWRKMWADAGLEDGLVLGYTDPKDLLEDATVAIPGGGGAAAQDAFWASAIGIVKRNRVKVIARGVTAANQLRHPWYACTSSAWTGFGRWGHVYFWNEAGRKMELFKRPEGPDEEVARLRMLEFEKRGAVSALQNYGLLEGIQAGKQNAFDLWNLRQWRTLQDHFEGTDRNAYWLVKLDEKDGRSDMIVKAAAPAPIDLPRYSERMQRSKALPVALTIGRRCNGCSLADRCPMFQADAECALSELRPIESNEDVVSAVQMLLAMQFDRVQFGFLGERLNGGFLDETASRELQKFMDLLKDLKDLSTKKETITVQSEGGVLSRVFGSLLESASGSSKKVDRKDPNPDVIDVGDE